MGDLASMQIAPEQAALMTLLVRAIGARRALELGTFTGYGAIAIARGLPDDGQLVCCDLDEEYASRARGAPRARPGSRSRSSSASARRSRPCARCEPTEQFDFAFIDADKADYLDYYEETLPRTPARTA